MPREGQAWLLEGGHHRRLPEERTAELSVVHPVEGLGRACQAEGVARMGHGDVDQLERLQIKA